MRPINLYLIIDRRRQRKTRLQREFRPRVQRLMLGIGAVLAILFMGAVIAAGFAYSSLTRSLPSVDLLPILLDRSSGLLLEPTRLYDRAGQTVLLALENPGIPRRFLAADPGEPDHFDPLLIQYTISMLDPGFWQHPGFLWDHLTDPQPQTIPETLVQSLLLENEAPGLRRSLRMRLLASQAVSRYGRIRVLEWYLNSQSFGHLAYGADAAARLYLDRSAADLSLAEVALILAVREAPALNPLDAPAAAIENQQDILRRLLDLHLISTADYRNARAEKLDLRVALQPANPPAPAFTALVLDQLANRLGSQQVERGGLEIITTLDIDLQRQTNCTLKIQQARLQSVMPDTSGCEAARLLPTLLLEPVSADLSGSAVILDPSTGQVLAYAGDNGSTRQPGSILTPFVAVAAFARGMSPATLTWDIPGTLPASLDWLYKPDQYHGPVRLRNAIANGYLTPLTDLLLELGSHSVWRTAETLGLTGLSTPNPDALLFEGGNVSLLQIAQAYSSFASLGSQSGVRQAAGMPLQPALILTVTDLDGRILLDQTQPETQPVLSESLAYLVHHILSDDSARRASLGYPNALEIGMPSGALLGGTADGRQVWTAGYTRQRVVVTWLGVPESSADQLSPKSAGGLWHALMQYASRDLAAGGWTAPAGVTTREVCDPSGLLPTTICPNIVPEVFISGFEPLSSDTLYRDYAINRETGKLATVFTSPELVEERIYLVPPLKAQDWARSMGLPIPPDSYDVIQAPPVKADVNLTAPALFSAVHGEVNIIGTAAGADFSSWSVQAGAGINPRAWVQIGETGNSPVVAGRLVTWDTRSLEDGLYAVRLLVVRRNAGVDGAIIQVTVDNTPPQVISQYPSKDAVLNRPASGTVILQAEWFDAAGMDRVEWWLDGVLLGSRNGAEGMTAGRGALLYSLPWTAKTGDHQLVVKAWDLAGNPVETEEIHFTVRR